MGMEQEMLARVAGVVRCCTTDYVMFVSTRIYQPMGSNQLISHCERVDFEWFTAV